MIISFFGANYLETIIRKKTFLQNFFLKLISDKTVMVSNYKPQLSVIVIEAALNFKIPTEINLCYIILFLPIEVFCSTTIRVLEHYVLNMNYKETIIKQKKPTLNNNF